VQRKNGGTSHPDKLLKEIKSFNNWLDNCPVRTTTFSTRCYQRVLLKAIPSIWTSNLRSSLIPNGRFFLFSSAIIKSIFSNMNPEQDLKKILDREIPEQFFVTKVCKS